MSDEAIAADLRDFILRHIASVAHVEALLLLRADPAAGWDAATLAKRLYTTEQNASAVLDDLKADGFLACENTVYRFDCPSAELAGMAERLAGAYASHLIPITNIIHARPRRIREFADAFKFRKGR